MLFQSVLEPLLAAARLGDLSSTANASALVPTYALPELPYAYDALEPYISKQIMELHHSGHHAAYVAGLNTALGASASALTHGDLAGYAAQLPAVRFHAGGHVNHALFWRGLTPAASPEASPEAAPALTAAITAAWGSLDAFRADLSAHLLGIRGSGWGWLVRERTTGSLRLVTLADQETVVGALGDGATPVLGIDMWEHAYYLQYLNRKATYVDAVWNVINWKTAEERFVGGVAEVLDGVQKPL